MCSSDLIAEGEAGATRAVFSAIHEGDPTPDLLALKYLDALRGIADGRATKIFLPNEMSGLFGAVGGLAEMLRQPSDDGERATVETDGALSSEAESSAS